MPRHGRPLPSLLSTTCSFCCCRSTAEVCMKWESLKAVMHHAILDVQVTVSWLQMHILCAPWLQCSARLAALMYTCIDTLDHNLLLTNMPLVGQDLPIRGCCRVNASCPSLSVSLIPNVSHGRGSCFSAFKNTHITTHAEQII